MSTKKLTLNVFFTKKNPLIRIKIELSHPVFSFNRKGSLYDYGYYYET